MDCACAMQNIFLAAKSLGIGSCWINLLGQTCDDPDVRAFLTKLGIPENHRVYGCAALGYAAAAPVKEKKLAEGTVSDTERSLVLYIYFRMLNIFVIRCPA